MSGVQLFTPDLFPSLSTACSTALSANISCSYIETGDETYHFNANYTTETLSYICSDGCSDSIHEYRSSVISACGNETYSVADDDGEDALVLKPIALPDYYLNNYFQRCLSDSDGNFCYLELVSSDEETLGCGECELKMIQAQLNDAFSYDEEMATTYSSLTSSCKVTDMPVNPPTAVIVSSRTAAAATPACTGTTVTIKANDTCDSIAGDNNISTWDLLASNGLDGSCVNFPKNGTLCIESSCPTYIVSANETCRDIAQAHNITEVQLRSYNPQIDEKCTNLNQAVGHHICVDSPYGPVATVSSPVTSPAASATEAPVPTNAADASNRHCGKWYSVTSGDYCESVMVKNGITWGDFRFLNPQVNANCTNLLADISYCVKAVGDIATYSGYATATMTGTRTAITLPATTSVSYGSEIDLDDLPTATPIFVETPQPGFPLADGTRKDCFEYQDVSDGPERCDIFAFVHSIPLYSFVEWNPSLDFYNCTLKNETRYCSVLGDAFVYEAPTTHAYAEVPDNAADNSTNKCYFWWETVEGDTCDQILQTNDISIDYFYKWNPAVKDDCTGMWPDVSYCVMGYDWQNASYPWPATNQTSGNATATATSSRTISTATASATTTATGTKLTTTTAKPTATSTKSATTSTKATCTGSTVTPPAATLSGIPCSCNKYAKRENGAYCYDMAESNGITLEQFYKWNPGVGSDCQYLQDDYVYCVGVAS